MIISTYLQITIKNIEYIKIVKKLILLVSEKYSFGFSYRKYGMNICTRSTSTPQRKYLFSCCIQTLTSFKKLAVFTFNRLF